MRTCTYMRVSRADTHSCRPLLTDHERFNRPTKCARAMCPTSLYVTSKVEQIGRLTLIKAVFIISLRLITSVLTFKHSSLQPVSCDSLLFTPPFSSAHDSYKQQKQQPIRYVKSIQTPPLILSNHRKTSSRPQKCPVRNVCDPAAKKIDTHA